MADAMGCKVYDEEKTKINADDIKEDELESTKAEMTGVKEENLRLKTLLQQVEKDYKTLQMRFMDVIQQDTKKNHDDREHDLVSLRLGTVTDRKRDDSTHVASATSNSSKSGSENDELKLGLECNFEGSKDGDGCPGKREDDLEGVKKLERNGDEECSQTSVKRARVCVRARCDTPTMNDGCQWRKYGQKISKGNPCPRSYYRCTVSPSCPVRKQVQRSAEDMSILTTTYEGTHNHPLPLSATAMASTTSAAASMLLSGSTTSQTPATAASTPTSLYRPPFQSSNNNTTQPYYYNSSPAAFPTITLDLTTNPSPTSGGFGVSPSSFQMTPRVPTTSLSFSSMNSSMMIPAAWGSGALSYGTLPYNNNHHSLQFGKPIQEHNYQQYLEKFNQGSSQQALTETLTKVITSDPSFRSVIEAAISSMSANGGPGKVNNSKGEILGPELKWGDHKPSTDGNQLT